MSALAQANPDLLETGIFTVSEAAKLVGVSWAKVSGWLRGYPQSNRGPLVDNDLGEVGGRLACSFNNLMELRFIAFFSGAGVSVPKIRAIMDEVERLIDHPRPFTTDTVFRTDGRKIMAQIGLENGFENIFDLHSRNYEMNDVVMESLLTDVIFDPKKGEARLWFPRRQIAPNVIINPNVSFGRPVLRDSRIPTRTLAAAAQAEGSVQVVADWYDVPEARVREAIEFENNLKKAA
jgi:uncharacterized protein (DUF433 family)